MGDIRDCLMFGESNIGDAGHESHSKAAAMPDSAEVCGCNGVNKGSICKAIKEKGLFTLDEVRKHIKASASCGSCTGLVEQILMFTAGGDYSATPKLKAMCSCTDHGHQAVRDAIRNNRLMTIADTFKFMDWKTASELRRIADAVDKYKIPTVKVTGGQRIDLLGVKKEDLVNVWKDIGMPSGHAYAKALGTVKTCVGSEWCRMGIQDSKQMGKGPERAMWRMHAPHKVKFAVSGCPRNCAESGI